MLYLEVNRYDIFEEGKDYEKMSEIISDLKETLEFKIYGYCFMSNHVHLIINEQKREIYH